MMKRLLFFPGHCLLAYEWDGRHCRWRGTFEADAAGFRGLRDWLDEAPRRPVHLLLDVIEEEFHIEQVPHVIGRDRAELHQRTLDKRFRSTPYRFAARQRRQREGRRDDEIIVAGMTNPRLLQPWLDVIDSGGTPLRGIYSLPLVGEMLSHRLGSGRRPLLLVSQQSPGTLRQSYYDAGQLRFSRLVPGRYEDTAGFTGFVEREIEQTLHYLASQRLRARREALDVVVLTAAGDDPAGLASAFAEDERVHFQPLSIAQAGERIGLRCEPSAASAVALFAHALLRAWWPTNHYGLRSLRRHYFVQRTRIGLAAAAVGCALLAGVIGGAAWLQVEAYRVAAASADERAATFERRYQERLQELGAFDYRAVDVKEAVDLADAIAYIGRLGPGPAMAQVGAVLDRHPNILLGGLDWRATHSDTFDAGARAVAGRARTVLATGGTGQGGELYQLVAVRGDVVGFGGVYRRAIEYFDAFVDDLHATPAVDRVAVVQAPFDLEPDMGVSGDSGTGARDQRVQRAGFAIALRFTGESHDPP